MATKKTTAKETAKATEVKTAAKTEAKVEAKAPVKAEVKAPVKAETKAPVKKASKDAKVELFIEYNGAQVSVNEITENVKATYKANGGKGSIEKLEIYVKPDESTAYFVVNDDENDEMKVYFC